MAHSPSRPVAIAAPPPPHPAASSSPLAAVSTSPSTSSYTASLPPTYRRSSFPVSPAPLALLPGLGLEQRGCSSDLVPHPHPALSSLSQRLDCTDCDSTPTHSAPSSRKSSASSFDSLNSVDAPLSSSSSRASSILSDHSPSPSRKPQSSLLSGFDWGAQPNPATRSLSVSSGMDKAKREAVKGWEDPALAAARRALWDDVPDEVADAAKDGQAPPEVFVDEDEHDDGAGEADEEDDDDWQLPPARPIQSTLAAPVFSCLRASPSSRSALSLGPLSSSLSSLSSAASSLSASASCDASTSRSSSPASNASSTTISSTSQAVSSGCASVSFSAAPPQQCDTYSPTAYPRAGDAPVEKLSIREWMELQGVREAVGVWSGKIQKWDEMQAALSDIGVGASAAGKACGGVGALSGAGEERKGRPHCSLAAMVGVVQVARSTPSSPVSPCRNLPDVA
ncbi:hypothetical protein JCM10207_004965 [Rhodosporidiobolus poonsookiae]